MQAELNGFLLNEVVNGVMFLFAAVLYVNTLLDRRIGGTKRDRNFSMFFLFAAVYIGLMLVWLPLRHYGLSDWLDFLVSALRVLSAVFTYGYFASWIFSIAEGRGLAHSQLGRAIFVVMVAFFVLSVILRAATGNLLLANVPIFLYYLVLVVLACIYREAIGFAYAMMILVFVVMELLLQVQTWWDYTPANIFLVLGAMMVYSRAWLAEKEERIENERIMAEQRAELENARTKLVLSQIKPHFLYNTLSTVSYLCVKEPSKARDLCIDLTTYLRRNLSTLDGGRVVKFEDELEHVRTYLKIEQVRFGDKLKVAYDIRDAAFELPVLTIEPLVENAVKHGICQRREGGTVSVTTSEEPGFHVVIVEDDGVGFDVGVLDENEGDHVGLRSVRRRIEILSHGEIIVESLVGEGTVVTLRIPK